MTNVPPSKSLVPSINVGVVGHVDHGKTTLVQALTGVWTAKYSEELKRSMTIKLGYANGYIAYCEGLEGPEAYVPSTSCPKGAEPKILRALSYIDAPGHEVLMSVMLSGGSLMDAALVVIAANEPCPQPQTREHVKALEILGVEQVVVVQNKVDVVSPEEAKKNYSQIKEFLSTTRYEKVPIVPVSALHKANIDVLAMVMAAVFREPERDLSKPGLMLVARSFDVNLPGTRPENLVGGVVGGSLIKGRISVGDEVEVKPGVRIEVKSKTVYEPLTAKVVSIRYGDINAEEAKPGGLVALGTTLDPSLTKADAMVGQVIGHEVPDPVNTLVLEYHMFERVVGSKTLEATPQLRANDRIRLVVGTAYTNAVVTKISGEIMELKLEGPVVVLKQSRAAILAQVRGRWRLVGWGRPLS